MAKKKETLTIEEKLQNALVPDWEQPYKLPENWCWTRLGEVYKWGSGGTPSRKNPDFYTGAIPWVKTGELLGDYIFDTEEKITDEAIKKSSAKLFPIGTVIIAMYGATIGKVAILGVEATTNQACACALPNNYTYVKYLFYYATSQKDVFIKKGKGGAQPNISQEVIKQHEFPLPPLAEQKRIVDRIESLFSKLDEAKELAQNALNSFENRKSAILHKAFTGELTQKWREENGVSFDSWDKKALKNIIETIKTKYNPTTDSNEYKYVSLENIEKNNGITGYSTSENVKSIKTFFKKGDILYGKLRPYLNKHDIAYFVGICSTDILVFRAKIDVSAKFVNYIMNLQKFIEYAVSNSKGINLPRVSEKDILSYSINLPTLPEQQEIVRILDSIFAKETEAKELVSVIDKIDLIKKSILSKAFCGELGTNDAKDGKSIELLKEILEWK